MSGEPIPDDGASAIPKAEGPVIDVEPMAAPDEPPQPVRKKGVTPALARHVGLAALAVLAAGGVLLLIVYPWRPPSGNSLPQQIADRLNQLDARVKTLEDTPSPAPAPAPAPADPALAARVEKLESAAPAVTRGDADALRASVAALEERLGAERDARAALEARLAMMAASDSAATARTATLALAASALDDAVHAGRRYRQELTLVKQFAPDDPALPALEPFADRGIETLEALARDFDGLAQKALAAQAGPGGDGFWAKAQAMASGLVTVRRAGLPQEVPAAAAVSGIRQALAQGEARLALMRAQSLPAPAQETLKPWTARVAAREAALAAAGDLRARLLDRLAAAFAPAAAVPPSAPAPAP